MRNKNYLTECFAITSNLDTMTKIRLFFHIYKYIVSIFERNSYQKFEYQPDSKVQIKIRRIKTLREY